jgi:hypothetical protein
LKSLGTLDRLKTRKSKGAARILTTIARFAASFDPYLKVVDVLVSSNPEYAALCWGALRLVLQVRYSCFPFHAGAGIDLPSQLASNYTTFFDKLTDMIDRLSITLPQYGKVMDICKNRPNAQVRRLVEMVYGDILAIFHAAVKVFTKGSGSERQPFSPLLSKTSSNLECSRAA